MLRNIAKTCAKTRQAITNQLLYQLSYAGIYSVSDVIAQFPSC